MRMPPLWIWFVLVTIRQTLDDGAPYVTIDPSCGPELPAFSTGKWRRRGDCFLPHWAPRCCCQVARPCPPKLKGRVRNRQNAGERISRQTRVPSRNPTPQTPGPSGLPPRGCSIGEGQLGLSLPWGGERGCKEQFPKCLPMQGA